MVTDKMVEAAMLSIKDDMEDIDVEIGGTFARAVAYAALEAALSAANDEPIAWESTTVCYTKYVTDERYQKFSDAVKKWYKPYHCSSCSARPIEAPPEPVAYTIGEKTMDRIFNPSGMTNVSDLQAVFDAVETALVRADNDVLHQRAVDRNRYKEVVGKALRMGFELGFMSTSEGFNGEYPFDGDDFESVERLVKLREQKLEGKEV